MPQPRGPQHGQQINSPDRQDTRSNVDREAPTPRKPGERERHAASPGSDAREGKDGPSQPDRKQSQEEAAQKRGA